jgi:hypothetical protein
LLEIEEHWTRPQPDWARKRLLVGRLIGQHEHTVAQIMKIAGVCRQTVFTYRDKVVSEGGTRCSNAAGREHASLLFTARWL